MMPVWLVVALLGVVILVAMLRRREKKRKMREFLKAWRDERNRTAQLWDEWRVMPASSREERTIVALMKMPIEAERNMENMEFRYGLKVTPAQASEMLVKNDAVRYDGLPREDGARFYTWTDVDNTEGRSGDGPEYAYSDLSQIPDPRDRSDTIHVIYRSSSDTFVHAKRFKHRRV